MVDITLYFIIYHHVGLVLFALLGSVIKAKTG